MVLYHALIGVGEALITGTILAFILARRPELISAPSRGGTASKVGQFVAAGLVAALAVAALLAPLKSDHPDGLDHVAEVTGIEVREVEREGLLLNDYEIPHLEQFGWQTAATSLAGLLGTCVVFAMAISLGKAARWKLASPVTDGGHAA